MAAVGVYRTILACMACAVGYGLYAGWVWMLIDPSAPDIMWLARCAVLWPLLTLAFWPTTADAEDRVVMALCMLLATVATCAAWAWLPALLK